MASSIAALKRATTSRRFSKLICPASASPFRSFSTNSGVTNYGASDRSVDVERRSDRSVSPPRESSLGFFSDVFDPFSPTRSLSQVLNFMDEFMDSPFLSGGMGSSFRRGWNVKEDDERLLLRIDMPGLKKDDVKISVQQNTLIIKGEAEKESGEDDEESSGKRTYSSRMDLPPNLYKIDEIKAEMKNGVLKLLVPKVKGEERKDVFQVNVE